MIKQKHLTEIGDRVRLKGQGQDALYESACAGSEGWVREQRHDRLGYPEIFVEWDRHHWTYNGEDNGWTFEAHFDKVEGDKKDMSQDEQKNLLKNLAASMGYDLVPSGEKVVESIEPVVAERDFDKEYNDTAATALDAIADGVAFFTIVVRKVNKENTEPLHVAEIINHYKDETAQYLLEANLSQLASLAHGRAVAAILRGMHDKEEDKGE